MDVMPHPHELALTVVQPEVLIEATQHLCQMLLLLPAPPVATMHDPFPCAREELPATLGAGNANQSESPGPIHPTDMLEAQKLESLRSSLSIAQPCDGREAPKEYAPSLLLGQLQSELRKSLPHFRLEAIHVLSVLKTHHEVVSEPH